jgi:hypothetical protein
MIYTNDPLSPATRAVYDAFNRVGLYNEPTFEADRMALAAALRAVADYVVPWQPEPTEDSIGPTIDYGYAWALFSKANDIRQELITIADELESQ